MSPGHGAGPGCQRCNDDRCPSDNECPRGDDDTMSSPHEDPSRSRRSRRRSGLRIPAVGGTRRPRWGLDGAAASVDGIARALRVLAAADPSFALVSSMHPAVLSFWLTPPESDDARWQRQRRAVVATALAGQRWGTITSEPGSGGDILRTRAVAKPDDRVGSRNGPPLSAATGWPSRRWSDRSPPSSSTIHWPVFTGPYEPSSPLPSWPRTSSPACTGSSEEERSPGARRSRTGSRMFGRSASSALPGHWPTTNSSTPPGDRRKAEIRVLPALRWNECAGECVHGLPLLPSLLPSR